MPKIRDLLARRTDRNLGTLGWNDTSATPMADRFRGGIP
jgi:hypothetical protein